MKFIIGLVAVIMAITITNTTNVSAQKQQPKGEKSVTYIMTVTQGNKELGKIEIKLWPDVAPKHAAFFEARIAEGWYDGCAFHRVIPGFMIQGGDPNTKTEPRNTWGTGGHPEKVVAEFNTKKHVRGVLSAARTADPNSFGGQFFLCVADSPWLDNQYTAFGEAISGMEVADAVVNSPRDSGDNPLEKITFTIAKSK